MSISREVTINLFRKYAYGKMNEYDKELAIECANSFAEHYINLIISTFPEVIYGDFRGLSDDEYHAFNEAQSYIAIHE